MIVMLPLLLIKLLFIFSCIFLIFVDGDDGGPKLLCDSVDEEIIIYNKYYLTEFTNKADLYHARRLSSLLKRHSQTDF